MIIQISGQILKVRLALVVRKVSELILGLHSGRDFTLTFESPRSDQVALFRHGERVFDHVMLFPPKSKGTSLEAQEDHEGLFL